VSTVARYSPLAASTASTGATCHSGAVFETSPSYGHSVTEASAYRTSTVTSPRLSSVTETLTGTEPLGTVRFAASPAGSIPVIPGGLLSSPGR
jgi:hypothetical protein